VSRQEREPARRGHGRGRHVLHFVSLKEKEEANIYIKKGKEEKTFTINIVQKKLLKPVEEKGAHLYAQEKKGTLKV